MPSNVSVPSKNGKVAKAAEATEVVAAGVPQIRIERIYLKLIGDSPLIVHAWSEKARKIMLSKQMKEALSGKAAKDPVADFIESLYVLEGKPIAGPIDDDHTGVINADECAFGFPVVGFKASAVSACRFVDGAKMTMARGAFHIEGEFATIESPRGPVMREDMVRVGMGTADIRFRGEFRDWSVILPIVYNSTVITYDQIANYFNLAGFGVGVGEWRPEKDGSNGRFHVALDGE